MMTDDAFNETLNAGEADREVPVETSPAFAVTGEGETSASPPPPNGGLLASVREWLGGGNSRLRELDAAIERYPSEAGSYLLRAELLMERGRRGDEEAAALDFYRAAALAAAQLENEDWGIHAQMVRDRALAGLNELRARGILIENA